MVNQWMWEMCLIFWYILGMYVVAYSCCDTTKRVKREKESLTRFGDILLQHGSIRTSCRGFQRSKRMFAFESLPKNALKKTRISTYEYHPLKSQLCGYQWAKINTFRWVRGDHQLGQQDPIETPGRSRRTSRRHLWPMLRRRRRSESKTHMVKKNTSFESCWSVT